VLSASAVERIGDFWYLAGDNSVDLYRLNDKAEVVGTTRLQETAFSDGSVVKGTKLDLEAAAVVNWQGRQELLLFGSGSKRVLRDDCFRIDVTHPAKPVLLEKLSLTGLHNVLRADTTFVGSQKLNIEGATVSGESLLLFQRGNLSGLNGVAEFSVSSFMNYLDRKAVGTPPKAVMSSVVLPKLHELNAGFSDVAALSPGRILFSASVEATADEVDDGKILGSFIGLLEKKSDNQGWAVKWTAQVVSEERSPEVKIEGIAFELSKSDQRAVPSSIVAVTDTDGGASEWLEISLRPI